MLEALDAAYSERSRIADALLRIGGRLAERAVVGIVDDMRRLWRLARIDLNSALERCAQVGWLDSNGADVEENGDDDVSAFSYALRKNDLMFDVHTYTSFPYTHRHDELIQEFARHSRGLLPVEAVYQTGSREEKAFDEPAYHVQFVLGERLYRATTRNMGDYCDTATIVAMLHRALADHGRSERFVELILEDRESFLFADPGEIETIAKALFIRLSNGQTVFEESIRALRERILGVDHYVTGGLAFHAWMPTELDSRTLFERLDHALSKLGLVLVVVTVGALASDRDKTRSYRAREATTAWPHLTIELDVCPGWTQLWLQPIERTASETIGAKELIRFFRILSESLPITLARTSTTGGFGRIQEPELVGSVDWLDWYQYFSPDFARRLGLERLLGMDAPGWTHTENGGYSMQLGRNPFRVTAAARGIASQRLGIGLRRLPREERRAQEEKDRLAQLPANEVEPWDDDNAIARARREGNPYEDLLLRLRKELAGDVVPAQLAKTIRRTLPFIEAGLFEASSAPTALASEGEGTRRAIEKRQWGELQKLATGSLKAAAVWGVEAMESFQSRDDFRRLHRFLGIYCDGPLDTGILDRLAVWNRGYEQPTALRSTVRVLTEDKDNYERPRRHDNEVVQGAMRLAAATASSANDKLGELYLIRFLYHDDLELLKSFLKLSFRDVLLSARMKHETKRCTCQHCEALTRQLKPSMPSRSSRSRS